MIPASNSSPITIPTVQKEKIVNLNEEFTLQKNEIATIKGLNVSLRIIGFTNNPCPKNALCFISGQSVEYELTVDGKIYQGSSVFNSGLYDQKPYKVIMKKSDYETYATFIINTHPKYDHASDYSWVSGTLQHYTIEGGCWILVFTDRRETTELYNGRLALDISPSSTVKLQDGSSTIVRGKLGKSSFSMNCPPQHYEVEEIISR